MATATILTQTRNTGRLERRKARTRATILEAASTLFREQGFEKTSIAQIAEAADTGVGTLYGYFANKDEILREVLRHHGEEEVASFLSAVSDDTPAIDRLCLALGAFARWVRDNRTLLMSALEASSRVKDPDETPSVWVSKALAAMIRDGMEKGELRRVPTGMTARSLISIYSLAMLGIQPWQDLEDDPSTIEKLEHMVRGMLAA